MLSNATNQSKSTVELGYMSTRGNFLQLSFFAFSSQARRNTSKIVLKIKLHSKSTQLG